MFTSNHAIWKYALATDDPDNMLMHVEYLISEWESHNIGLVKFQSAFQIMLASYLLEDNLLPSAARTAFARMVIEVMTAARRDKLKIKPLHIYPPKPGRKASSSEISFRNYQVSELIRGGATANQAYAVVANERYKSIDTIRRDYERSRKRLRDKRKTGEIKI